MSNKYTNSKERKSLLIESSDDYREKIKIAYYKWEEQGFSDEWLKWLENRWYPSTTVWEFIKLLNAKKTLSEANYKEKENEAIACFEKNSKALSKIILVMEAEEEAFKKAGIKEGTVEYTCPICGNKAIANRYLYDGRYHGLGSGCPTCGTSHS